MSVAGPSPIRALTFLWLVAAAMLDARPAAAQIPQRFENLKHFPQDIQRDALVQRMREFSFALNVRCQHCHAGGDGVSFDGVVFKSDEKVAKQKARFMLRLVDTLNNAALADLPGRSQPPVRIDCVTCHRGSALPKTLDVVLTEVIEKDGAAAAATRYRELRERTMVEGRYDFSEWSINELARTLAERKNVEAAIQMLEVNAEFNPKSADIDFQLAELFRGKGERAKAIARYKSALEKSPAHVRAKNRLAELEREGK